MRLCTGVCVFSETDVALSDYSADISTPINTVRFHLFFKKVLSFLGVETRRYKLDFESSNSMGISHLSNLFLLLSMAPKPCRGLACVNVADRQTDRQTDCVFIKKNIAVKKN